MKPANSRTAEFGKSDLSAARAVLEKPERYDGVLVTWAKRIVAREAEQKLAEGRRADERARQTTKNLFEK